MYGVLFVKDDSFHSYEVELDKAEHTARSLAKWNHGCEVVDMQTGEILQSFAPHLTPNDVFVRPGIEELVNS